MKAADLPALRRLYLECRQAAADWFSQDNLALSDFERDTEGEAIWVAEEADRIQGFVAAWLPDNFIHHLYIRPEIQGQGIGSELLDLCLAQIGRPARLKCVTENHRALAFYRARGWQTIDRGMGKDGEYQLMQVDACAGS